jgi:hypothetical protein
MATSLPVTYNLPDEMKEAVRKQLAYLIKLCPGWVNHLHVGFQPNPSYDEKGNLAHIQADYPYRRVYLTIFPAWLWENETARREVMVHEACHILNAPVQNFVNGSIKALFKNNRIAEDIFEAGWRQVNEAATEDMARSLLETAGWGEVEMAGGLKDVEQAEPSAIRGVEEVQKAE